MRCKRTLLLDGYNITCKALEISAIIKGSRGKRDSKGFKAVVNSLKTLPFSVGLLEGRGAAPQEHELLVRIQHGDGLVERSRSTKEGRGYSSRPVVTVENTTTEQAKVESCYMVPSSNWLGGQPFTLEIGVRTSVESPARNARQKLCDIIVKKASEGSGLRKIHILP